jgi:hypothetical protein
MWTSFPLLALVVITYNVLVLLFPNTLPLPLFYLPLPSGVSWPFLVNDLLLTAGLLLLYLEIFQATRPSTGSILNHGLSMLVFVVCLVEFMVLPALANSTFFLILLMTLIDVIAGFTVSISSARRDVNFQ